MRLSFAVVLIVSSSCTAQQTGKGSRDGTSDSTPTASGTSEPGPTTPARITDFTSTGLPGRAHQRTFSYTLDAAAGATLLCTVPGEPEERHRHVFEPAQSGEWTLYGLLAQTDHTCTLSTSNNEAELAFTTEPPLATLRRWETEGDPTTVWGHYTLVNQFVIGAIDQVATVFDPQGRVRWSHPIVEGASTGLELRYLGDGQMLIGGVTEHTPELVDLDGNTLWQLPDHPDGFRYHHDAVVTPDGTLLVIRKADASDGRDTWTGFVVEEWDLPPTNILWSWDVQQAFDAGQLPGGSGDVYHANAVVWMDDVDGQGVLISMSHLDQLARIDKATGDVLWTLGPGGTIALDEDAEFYGQHAPEVVGDRILLHDNGRFRPDGNWSRVLELQLDLVNDSASVVHDWREDGWYQKIWGDADRLDDGNILVSRGHCSTCGVPDQRTNISIIDPTQSAPLWKLWIDDADIGAYRAQRIDGCGLFENTRYCP